MIADGTPTELKEASRSAHLEVMLAAPHPDAVGAIAPLVTGRVHVSEDGRRLSAGVDAAPGLATSVVRALDAAGVLVDNIEVRQPSLDDVFFSLTGGHIEEDETRTTDAMASTAARRQRRHDGPARAGRSAHMTTTTLTPTTTAGRPPPLLRKPCSARSRTSGR